MAKIKMIASGYDKEKGIATVAIRTKYGIFEGTAKVHDEDRDIESEFVGCSYAETRAVIKYEKAKLNEFKNKLIIIENLKQGLEKLKKYNKNSAEARYIRKQYYITRELIKNQEAKIQFFNDYLDKKMENYRVEKENFNKKIKEIKEKRETTPEE